MCLLLGGNIGIICIVHPLQNKRGDTQYVLIVGGNEGPSASLFQVIDIQDIDSIVIVLEADGKVIVFSFIEWSWALMQ